MAAFEYPIKCTACQLHFTVWSWDDDWYEKHVAICPECGDSDFIGFPAKHHHEKQIFEFVPGEVVVENLKINYS